MRGGNRLVKVIRLEPEFKSIIVEDVRNEKRYKMNLRSIAKGDTYFYLKILGKEEPICSFSQLNAELVKTTSNYVDKINRAIPDVIVEQTDKIFDECFANKGYTVEVDFRSLEVIPADEQEYLLWGA
jgi:hypothetical protein